RPPRRRGRAPASVGMSGPLAGRCRCDERALPPTARLDAGKGMTIARGESLLLVEWYKILSPVSRPVKGRAMADSGGWLCVRGAREPNLHNINVDLPRDRLSVLTGPRGSGKSSLAFDTPSPQGPSRYPGPTRGDPRALLH